MSRMLGFTTFYTLTGLFLFGAVLALLYQRFTAAGVLLTVAGAGGLGVFWERWSSMSGDDVHIGTFAHPLAPTPGQWELLLTHLPMLIVGVLMIALVASRRATREGTADA